MDNRCTISLGVSWSDVTQKLRLVRKLQIPVDALVQ
jgi:hypothetical protein